MDVMRRHPILGGLGLIVVVGGLVVFGFGIYVASVAGELPWQTDPTRIADSITPFAGLDVFIPATKVPTVAGTPVS